MDIDILIKNKLEEIKVILAVETTDEAEIGVLSGKSGIALFQFYYAKLYDDEKLVDIGVNTIVNAIESIRDGGLSTTFCSGIAGACWTLELLQEEAFIEIDTSDLLSDLDEYLFQVMQADIKNENFDFLHGALGYGYYFLKRYKNTASDIVKKRVKRYLDDLVLALKKTSKKSSRGIWWESVLRIEEGLKGGNLGLSHGMSSIINFLSRLAEYDDFKSEVYELLQSTVSYVLSFKRDIDSGSSLFPNWIVDEKELDGKSRLAWCYGDLGIGISLLRAAEVLEDKKLYEEAMIVLKHSTKRKDSIEANIQDAGLCHGAYGVMQIYNYLYKKTSDILFKDATEYWAIQALELAIHDDGLAGYKKWNGGEKVSWKTEINLLEGVAGIGLAILSYLAPFEMKWDECLMIN